MTSKVVLLVLLSTFSRCHSLFTLVEPGKELIYDYFANINVGTYEPAIYASQFVVHGKLHMQNDQNSILMKLSDIEFKLYNGELNHRDEYEAIWLPLPNEAENLTKTFQISYNDDGKIKYFAAEDDDQKFSRDMKKAIASIMQLDLKEIKFDCKTPYAFVTHEDSVYGNVLARYNIKPEESGMKVQKMLDIESAKDWMAYSGITDEDKYEEFMSRKPISIEAHREYHLSKESTGIQLKQIEAQGGIYIHLLKGTSESQFMLVNQTMQLIQMVSATEKLTISDNKNKDDLKFKMEIHENDETLTDLSFERNEFTMEQYENLVCDILKEAVAYLKFQHLTPESPDLKAGQSINRLIRIMAMLDTKTLEKIFVTYEEKTDEEDKEIFKVFQEMVPLIGTRASVIFVRNLVRKQKVSDNVAISMLTQMPFHLRMPSKKLLKEVEDLIHLENVNSKVQKAGVLSFATLVHKVYSSYLMKHNIIKESENHEDLLEKYISKYMELLKSSKMYSEQYLYMHALYNIKMGSVMKYLEPYVKGETTFNRHLRFIAMCASYKEAIKNPKRVYEIYWPIFTDTSLHLEIRYAAYMTLMSTKPERRILFDIYWILKHDPCPELYHLHYTYMKSIVHSQDVMFQDYKIMAGELLNFMREPFRHPLSGIYIADYMDPKYGFGALFSSMFLSTNTSKAMYFNFNSNMYNLPVINFAVWLKIDGIDVNMLNDMPSHGSIEQLMKMIMHLKDQKNLHIEYAVLRSDQIIQLDFVDHTTIDTFKVDLVNCMYKHSMHISYELLAQQIMPNDLGFPTTFDVAIPSIINNQLQVSNDKTEEETANLADMKIQRASHAVYRTSFYNPVADIWQGIDRFQSNEIISTLSLRLSMSKANKYKLSVHHQADDTVDKFAMKNYATSFTHVYKDVDNVLQKSSNISQHFMKVSRGEQYRNSKLVFEHNCPHTGLLFQISTFDTKQHVSRKTIMEQIEVFFQKYFKNYQTMPLGYMLLTMQNSVHYLLMSPQVGTFGILIRTIPSKKFPVDHIDLNMGFNQEKGDRLTSKFNIKLNLATKSKEDKVLRSWDINTMMSLNQDHTLNNYNLDYSMEKPGEKIFKVCMIGSRKIIKNNIIGYHNISMGHTEEQTSCVDNEGFIEINMKAKYSDEQENMMKNEMTYDPCMPVHMHETALKGMDIKYHHNLECTMEKTYLRHYEYDIKTNGLSKEFLKNYYNNKFLKGMLFPYYSYEKVFNPVDENSMKVLIDYPVISDEINMEIMTKTVKHKINAMPLTWPSKFGFYPESYHFSSMFERLHDVDMIESCLIENQHIYNDNQEVVDIIDHEWMRIVHSNPAIASNETLIILVKKMEDSNQVALKIKMDDYIIEMKPEEESYKITWNDRPLPVSKDAYQIEEWFSIGMLNDNQNTIIMHVFNFPLYIEYDGDSIKLYKMINYMRVKGPCFMH